MLYYDMSAIDENGSLFNLDAYFNGRLNKSYRHWKKAFQHLKKNKAADHGGEERLTRTMIEQLTPPVEASSAVLSDESLSANGWDVPVYGKEALWRFKERLSRLFDDFEIVVYLRRQADYLTSFALNKARNGNDDCADALLEKARNPEADDPMLNYQVLLTMWAEVFGRDKMKVRLFDRKHFIGGDLIVDFATTCGLSLRDTVSVEPANESIDDDVVTFINRLQQNRQYETPNLAFKARKWLINVLSRKYKGKSHVLTRVQAERIVETYRDSNRAIAREYFGSEELFGEDCSMYPEEIVPHELTVEKSVEIAAYLCDEIFKQCDSLKKTIRKQKTSLDTNEVTIKSLEKKLTDFQVASDSNKKNVRKREETLRKQETILKKQTKAIKRHQAEIKRLKTLTQEMRLKNRLMRLLGRFHLLGIARGVRNGFRQFRRRPRSC